VKDLSFVNKAICDSIPISKDLKRYLLNRYRHLVDSNGPKYAADVFKNMSEVCLRYRADPRRADHLSGFLKSFPLKHKGWVKKVFAYMDCQPMFMLDFLKLYCGMGKPLVTVSQSAADQGTYLETRSAQVSDKVPGVLEQWIRFVLGPKPREYLIHRDSLIHPDTIVSRFYRMHGYQMLLEYYQKWNSIFLSVHRTTDEEAIDAIARGRVPVPEIYKDFVISNHSSERLEEDYWAFSYLLRGRPVYPFVNWHLSTESIDFLKSLNSQHPDAFNLWDKTDGSRGRPWQPQSSCSDLYASCVGEIQHIPKKGTVKRRPIAVPNRFIQMGLLPFQMQLDALLRRFPKDCTFNQSRFDVKITNRVSNPSLYVGSVDLSQATDNLPLSWGTAVIQMLIETIEKTRYPISTSVLYSYILFLDASRGAWMNNGYPAYWTVGQPLGTLPSFDMLAITHNCLCEALAFARGLSHSPYCILGDDLLIFNKRLRKDYILLMQSVGVPLSLQKSYEGNLVEFAGKIFIRNQVPKYRSDHLPITYQSLFDYQRATGVSVDFRKLPRKLKRKFLHQIVAHGLTVSDGVRVYRLIQDNLVKSDLDPSILIKNTDLNAAFWVELTSSEEKKIQDPILGSGIVAISGHPVTLGDYGYAEKDGHLQRFRQIELPKWYKDKVRPYTTDKLISSAVAALKQCDESLKETKGSTGC
jgi:hypothetical protein